MSKNVYIWLLEHASFHFIDNTNFPNPNFTLAQDHPFEITAMLDSYNEKKT